MKHLIAAFALSCLLSGCATMHFTNNQPVQEAPEYSVWHHTAAYSLLEVSAPVNMEQRCNGRNWQNIKTEHTFINGIAGSVDSFVPLVDLWQPWTVTYICSPE